MKQEQEKAQAALQAKLEARRNRKQASSKARLEKDNLLDDEELRRQELYRKMQDEVERKKLEEKLKPQQVMTLNSILILLSL